MMYKTISLECLVCHETFDVPLKGRIRKNFVCDGCKETSRLCSTCGKPIKADSKKKTCLRCRTRKKRYYRQAREAAGHKQRTGSEYVNAAKPEEHLPPPYLQAVPTERKGWVMLI